MTRPVGRSTGEGGFDFFAAMEAVTATPELAHALVRVLNLLEPPQGLFARLPDLQRAVATRQAERRAAVPDPGRPRRQRLTREEILAVA